MTTQTQLRSNVEAERLAKALEGDHPAVPGARTKNEAAAELRRLVSFNKDLMDEVARLTEALAEQPAQQDSPWCMKMNGCKTKCEDCPDEAPKIGCVNHDCDKCKAEQKDAARYQHIKGMARAMSLDINGNHYWTVALHGIRGPSLDEAIDRAIEAAHGIMKGNT